MLNIVVPKPTTIDVWKVLKMNLSIFNVRDESLSIFNNNGNITFYSHSCKLNSHHSFPSLYFEGDKVIPLGLGMLQKFMQVPFIA